MEPENRKDTFLSHISLFESSGFGVCLSCQCERSISRAGGSQYRDGSACVEEFFVAEAVAGYFHDLKDILLERG